MNRASTPPNLTRFSGRTRPPGVVLRLFAWLCWLSPALGVPAEAHPQDEASIYHYVWVEVSPKEVSLQHATVAGGLLAPVVWQGMDLDDDRVLSSRETAAYAGRLAESLQLTIDGKKVEWKLSKFLFPSHQEFFTGSLPAVRLDLRAPLTGGEGGRRTLLIRDFTYPQFLAVFPDPVVKSKGFKIALREPLDNGRKLRVMLAPVAGAEDESPRDNQPEAPSLRSPATATRGLADRDIFPDRRKVLYAAEDAAGTDDHDHAEGLKAFLSKKLTPGVLLLALAASFVAGAAHALTPGHGKSMVAAYLVGTRGTVRDAVLLGVTVTATHTGSVALLGVLCLWLTSRISAETVSTWLSLGSGVLVTGLGLWLFRRGWLAFRGLAPVPGHAHGHDCGHGHSHGHSHGDTHGPEPPPATEASGPSHGHHHDVEVGHHHGHTHSHSHGSPEAAPVPESGPPRDAPLTASVARDRPDPDTRRGVIGLGIAGGLVPCFDALAILIAAVHLKSIPLGLLLIFSFSLGMAAVLVLIGVLMVTAGSRLQQFASEARWVRAMPAASGAVLSLLGLWLTWTTLADLGWLPRGG